MKLFLKRLIAVIKTLYRKVKLRIDFVFLRSKVALNTNINEIPEKSIFILAPHADDEWVGCSQILSHMENVVICNMSMSGGDSIDLHKLREQEMQNIAQIVKKKLVTIEETREKKVVTLKKLLEENKPEFIAVPFFFDWHKEHIEVMRILRDVIVDMSIDLNILMYQVSVPIPEQYINYCSRMTRKEHKDKWQVFYKVYQSQLIIPWKRFQYNERILGKMCGAYAAEVFCVESSNDWKRKLEERILREEEQKEIKAKLQDIVVIRKTIEKMIERKNRI